MLRRALAIVLVLFVTMTSLAGFAVPPAAAVPGCSCPPELMCVKAWVKVAGNTIFLVNQCQTPPAGWTELMYLYNENEHAGAEFRIYSPV